MTSPEGRPPEVAESVHVGRAAHEVWRAIADPQRMVTWSPEATAVRVDAPAPLAVGDTFAGTNARSWRRWSTACRVVESSPGHAFAFDVTYLGLPVARWRYAIADEDGGCRVEEQWWDSRGWLLTALGGPATGVTDRATHNRATMRATLDALKRDLESP